MRLSERINQSGISTNYSKKVSIYSIIELFGNGKKIFDGVKAVVEAYLRLPTVIEIGQIIDGIKSEMEGLDSTMENYGEMYDSRSEALTQLKYAQDSLATVNEKYLGVYKFNLMYDVKLGDYIQNNLVYMGYESNTLYAIEVGDILTRMRYIYEVVYDFIKYIMPNGYPIEALSNEIKVDDNIIYDPKAYTDTILALDQLGGIDIINDYREIEKFDRYLA